MNSKLIEQIKKNDSAISLVKLSSDQYEVINKKGITTESNVFFQLKDALRCFNELVELLEKETVI